MPPLSKIASILISPNKLILKIAIGIVLGVVIGSLLPEFGGSVSLLGALFVKALKAIAPLLVFILVASAVANHQRGNRTAIRPIILLYCFGTLSAALVAVLMSFLFPVELILTGEAASGNAPESLKNVLQGPIFQLFDNPVNALLGGNYIALILWAVALGIGMQSAADSSKRMLKDLADAITAIVRFIIVLAPFGIFGLVAGTVAATGLSALSSYMQLIAVLLASMLIVALVVNPLIVFCKLRVNPYPLVFQCLRDSGMTAFFTRSSAANIPVNMALCKRLNVNPETYSVSIPLGASVNMGGAAITISVLTLATAHTLGIEVGFLQAFTLCVVASISACGASGVAGGSLLLIPLACGLFAIPNDIAMQVVALGFIIGVVQDSAETALNSSTDVLFTVTCDRASN